MRTARVIAVLALLGMAGSALAQDYVTVERHRPSSAGVVLRDTIAGGVVGSAVAGGVILYQTQINDRSNYDWGRTLAWGAVIGLGAGLVWGLVDAASGPAYAAVPRAPVSDGMSMSLDVRNHDQSHAEIFPLMLHRF